MRLEEDTFYIPYYAYLEGADEEDTEQFIKENNIDFEELKKNGVEYAKVDVDNENRKAYVTFIDKELKPLTQIIEDDWYVVMDCLFGGKWLDKYEIEY